MKKLLFLLTSFLVFTSSFASFEIRPTLKKATEIFLPISKNMQISLMDLSVINIKDFEKLTGKHLNFFDKLSFRSLQKKLKKDIKSDGSISDTKFMKFMSDGDHSTGFHLGGFLLGFFFLFIGIGIAYIIGGDEDVRKNRVKWAWIGSGIGVIIYVAILKALVGD